MSAQNKQTAAAKIRESSSEELSKKFRDNRQEILNLRLRNSSGQVANPIRIRTLRRENARIKTILAEKTVAK